MENKSEVYKPVLTYSAVFLAALILLASLSEYLPKLGAAGTPDIHDRIAESRSRSIILPFIGSDAVDLIDWIETRALDSEVAENPVLITDYRSIALGKYYGTSESSPFDPTYFNGAENGIVVSWHRQCIPGHGLDGFAYGATAAYITSSNETDLYSAEEISVGEIISNGANKFTYTNSTEEEPQGYYLSTPVMTSPISQANFEQTARNCLGVYEP